MSSYDIWKLRAPEDEPGYDGGVPEIELFTCTRCDREQAEPGTRLGSAYLCDPCAANDPILAAERDRAYRRDCERDEDICPL